MTDITHIRNFAIIAHIDHGKSTLADRLIELCGNITEREKQEQILDSMDIERKRGITIKSQTVRLNYRYKDGHMYELNLIDTPGHVDFSYEVSRSLSACEGSILVVDATQGVEAQTHANVFKALENDHVIIPVINKIDLPAADPEGVKEEIQDVLGLDTPDSVNASAKTGIGITDVLDKIVEKIPHPDGNADLPLKALLIDSWYDQYIGVVVIVRIKDGILKPNTKLLMMSSGFTADVESIGIFRPKPESVQALYPGEIGFIKTNVKNLIHCKIGDTLTYEKNPTSEPLPGFKPSVPFVFCAIFPIETQNYNKLRDSLQKLQLNDSSFSFEPESSPVLGFGFRCGFLGFLHLDIIRERLEREYDIDIITTPPNVLYKIVMTNGAVVDLRIPSDMPDLSKIDHIKEPMISATIMTPERYLGAILTLCEDKRGEQISMNYSGNRIILNYKIPLNEIVIDFYDKLKSVSQGYASFDYEITGYQESDLVKLDILINEDIVDALSMIVHRSKAEKFGRDVCERLKTLIPKHLFKIPIQAAIGSKVIARETISALRKDVTAKCYGGDITRKRKLLEKQKEGKKRMKAIGKVNIPSDTFIKILQK